MRVGKTLEFLVNLSLDSNVHISNNVLDNILKNLIYFFNLKLIMFINRI